MEETAGIMISSGAVGAICALVSSWLKTRISRKTKRPLDHDDVYVTHGECREHRCALDQRLSEARSSVKSISDKLDLLDQRAEERSEKLHRRIDPLIDKVAANSAEINALRHAKSRA